MEEATEKTMDALLSVDKTITWKKWILYTLIGILVFTVCVDALVYYECDTAAVILNISTKISFLWNMFFTKTVCSTTNKIWVPLQIWRHSPIMGTWLHEPFLKSLLIFLSSVVLVSLPLGGCVLYFYLKKDKDTETGKDKTEGKRKTVPKTSSNAIKPKPGSPSKPGSVAKPSLAEKKSSDRTKIKEAETPIEPGSEERKRKSSSEKVLTIDEELEGEVEGEASGRKSDEKGVPEDVTITEAEDP